MSLGFSVWNVLNTVHIATKWLKLLPHKATLVQSSAFSLGSKGWIPQTVSGDFIQFSLLIYLHFIGACIDEICNNHNSRY
jgi:hypothetical protein